MVLRYLLFFLLAYPFVASAAPSAECEAALKTLFSEKIPKEQASEFLKLQGDITLHRLAWAYLKAQKSDQTEKLESVERGILSLLDEKYTTKDPEFIKARNAYENQPLSRTALAEIAPYLKDVLGKDFGEGSEPFILNASDLKLLHALSKFEKASEVNGKYDSRMLAQKSPKGMLNFMTLINSSYKVSQTKEEQSLDVELRLQGLEKTLKALHGRLRTFLKKLETPSQCMDEGDCELPQMDELFEQNQNVQNILWDSLADKLESDDLLLDNLSYGEIWLRTNGAVGITKQPSISVTSSDKKNPKISSNNPGATKKSATPPDGYRAVVVAGKTKITRTSPVRTAYSSSTGLYIEDPVNVIVKDKAGRDGKAWRSFDQNYLEKFSDAILNDDKLFEIDGKLYDRNTGKEVEYDTAFNMMPPAKRSKMSKFFTSYDSRFQSKQVAAMVNGEGTFVYKGKLYGIDGKEQNPALVIQTEVEKKTNTKLPLANIQKMDQGYLVERASALSNNKPHFKVGNQVLDTQTGRNISSPFRSYASIQNVKVEKQRRVEYQNLSDRETIVNYNRDKNSKSGCQHYAVVDKANAVIDVYSLGGEKVFHAEVLLGSKRTDERTSWNKGETNLERSSNRATGAGIFTILPPRVDHSYYKKTYSQNILQLSSQVGDEQVLAIHQVPNTMPERYKLFGGSAEQRRVSGGCTNLKQADYKKFAQFIKPSCKIYILPEEANNKYIVKDGVLKFVSTTNVKNHRDYNYSPGGTPAKSVNVNFVSSQGKTGSSVKFMEKLKTDKAKLMKLLNLSNDEYNDLMLVAYGIMGQESNFGQSSRFWLKETNQDKVVLAKFLKKIVNGENPFDKETINTSRGYTQIKDLPPGPWKEAYPHINKSNLTNPENSAVATMAYMADAMYALKNAAKTNQKNGNTKVRITKENMVDYMAYIYQGKRSALTDSDEPATPDFNTYVQNIRRNMTYIELTQKIE